MIGVALATVSTTEVSAAIAHEDHAKLQRTIATAVGSVLLLLLGSAVGMGMLSSEIIGLLFERGAFDRQDTLETARALIGYALALAPYGLVKVLAPVYYGLARARVPLVASLVAIVCNIAWSLLTYRELGAMGLALGTAVAALVNAGLLFSQLGVARPRIDAAWLTRKIAAVSVALALLAGWSWLMSYTGVQLLVLTFPIWPKLILAAWLAIAAGVGASVYLLALVLLRVVPASRARSLLAGVSRRFAKRKGG